MPGVQQPRAGGHGDDRRLEEDLDRWTAASVITPEQANAIRRLETAEAEHGAPANRIPLIAEALGFLGGALAVGAGMIVASRYWEDLSTAARLITIGTVAAALVVAGRAVRREGEPALAHLGSFLWVLATGAACGWGAILAYNALGWRGADVVLAAGLAALALALPLWAWRSAPLQHVAAFAALIVTVAGSAGQLQHTGGIAIGISLWALGVIWVVLGWLGLVKPTPLAFALGGVLTIAAGRVLGGEGWWADVLTIATALALLAASVPTRSMVLLWVGVVAVFVAVPFAVTQHFGDSLGVPLALFLAGMALIGVAVAASRLVREVRAEPPKPSRFSPRAVGATIIGSVAAVVVATLTITLVTMNAVPSFASLQTAPDGAIAGSVAFLRGQDGTQCLFVTAAGGGGSARKLLCDKHLDTGPMALDWNSAGHITARRFAEATGEQLLEIDPASGAVLARQVTGEPGKGPLDKYVRASDGAGLETRNSDFGKAELLLHPSIGSTAGRVVLSVNGPRDYRFEDAIWSPDGTYALVTDSEHRMLVVDVDSAAPAGRVLTDGHSPAWSEAGV
jgi:hypothetical protein